MAFSALIGGEEAMSLHRHEREEDGLAEPIAKAQPPGRRDRVDSGVFHIGRGPFRLGPI